MLFRQSTFHFLILGSVLLSTFFQVVALADLIEFEDNSNIFGKVKRIRDGKVFVKTLFAGDIVVEQDQITTLSIEEKVYIALKDGLQLFGEINIKPDPSDSSIGDEVQQFDISKIFALWREGDEPVALEIEDLAIPPKKPKWRWEASLNLTGRTGNSEKLATSGNLTATLLGKEDQLKLFFSVDQAESNDNKTSDELKGGFDFEAGFPERQSGFIRAEAESDEIERIDLRLTTAIGYGYYFLKNDHRQLRGRIGMQFRHEDFIDNGRENDPGVELGLFNLFRFNERITVKTDITYIQGVDEVSDFRSIHNSSLEFPLGSNYQWKIRLGVLNEFDNEPAQNAKRLDTRYFVNFVLSWEQLYLIYIKTR